MRGLLLTLQAGPAGGNEVAARGAILELIGPLNAWQTPGDPCTLMIADDGDIIRGIGYVALYSAYLEEAIDQVVEALIAHRVPAERNIVRAPASRKIRFSKDSIGRLISSNEEMARLDQALDYASQLLEERNVVIHGRIYANSERRMCAAQADLAYPTRKLPPANFMLLPTSCSTLPGLSCTAQCSLLVGCLPNRDVVCEEHA
jgi:hypothetical protein